MALVSDFPVKSINGGIFTTTISNGGTVSDTLSIDGASVVGVAITAPITSCNLSFNVSLDNDTFWPLCDSNGNAVSIPVSTTGAISGLGGLFLGYLYVQAVSSATQLQNVVVTFIMRDV